MAIFNGNNIYLENEVKNLSEDELLKKIKEKFGAEIDDFLVIMKSWKDNKKVVLELIKITNPAFVIAFMKPEFKEDKYVVNALLKKNAEFLEDVAEKWKADKKTVLKVMKSDALALRYASEDLQNDKELLMILKDKVNGLSYKLHQKWYEERMYVLNILEQEELMKKEVNLLEFQKISVKKF